MLLDRNRKAQLSFEQLTTELQAERSVSHKIENQRSLLEKQNKDLKSKLNELETSTRTRTKATISALEAKVANLEEQLENEAKYAHLSVYLTWNPSLHTTILITGRGCFSPRTTESWRSVSRR